MYERTNLTTQTGGGSFVRGPEGERFLEKGKGKNGAAQNGSKVQKKATPRQSKNGWGVVDPGTGRSSENIDHGP